MKAVALNTGGADVQRQRNEIRDRRMAAVKTGVEASDLRHFRQAHRHRFDGGEVVRLMEGRQRHEIPQLRRDFRRDHDRIGKGFAAMDHAMSDADDLSARVHLPQPRGERIERAARVVNRVVKRAVDDRRCPPHP